jgi:hypothetical protein
MNGAFRKKGPVFYLLNDTRYLIEISYAWPLCLCVVWPEAAIHLSV